MGQVVSFSNVEKYLVNLQQIGRPVRAILDTNVLAALTYEVKINHEEVNSCIGILERFDVQTFATVNTKQEFIDFHRRLLLTESLLDLVHSHDKVQIPTEAKRSIQRAYATVMSRQKSQGSDPIFSDSQIKGIKSEFSAGSHSGHLGWLKFCEAYSWPRLLEVENELEKEGITYLSPNDFAQATHFFATPLRWQDAIELVCRTGVSMADAMILNCLQSSVCQFVVSNDFDLGFAVLADAKFDKVVVMPDDMCREFRHYHFP